MPNVSGSALKESSTIPASKALKAGIVGIDRAEELQKELILEGEVHMTSSQILKSFALSMLTLLGAADTWSQTGGVVTPQRPDCPPKVGGSSLEIPHDVESIKSALLAKLEATTKLASDLKVPERSIVDTAISYTSLIKAADLRNRGAMLSEQSIGEVQKQLTAALNQLIALEQETIDGKDPQRRAAVNQLQRQVHRLASMLELSHPAHEFGRVRITGPKLPNRIYMVRKEIPDPITLDWRPPEVDALAKKSSSVPHMEFIFKNRTSQDTTDEGGKISGEFLSIGNTGTGWLGLKLSEGQNEIEYGFKIKDKGDRRDLETLIRAAYDQPTAEIKLNALKEKLADVMLKKNGDYDNYIFSAWKIQF